MSCRIALLALQGAFAEHGRMFHSLGAEVFELRNKHDLGRKFDALVLPGGESTVQGKLLRELDMFDFLAQRIADGVPVFATCAGIILLAQEIADSPVRHFAVLPAVVRRNAYGRQLDSFVAAAPFADIGEVTMPFIRAPQIISVAPEVKILGRCRDLPVAVEYKNIMAMTFHPEITASAAVHRHFLRRIAG